MPPHDEVDLRLQVANRHTGAERVVLLDLRDPSGAELPTWTPGAHIDLELPDDLVRQYSLCGDPADHSAWRIAVLREANSRGGSEHIHESLVEGATVDVRGPRNHFPLLPSPNYIFIVGGIGITPILPMLTAADVAGAEWELHYGGRSRRSMAFRDVLETATDNRVTLHPQNEIGLIDLPRILGTPRPDTLVQSDLPQMTTFDSSRSRATTSATTPGCTTPSDRHRSGTRCRTSRDSRTLHARTGLRRVPGGRVRELL
jgi:ferredoxin-NADP reductase